MKQPAQIIIAQATSTDATGRRSHQFRIAKLIGAVSVFCGKVEYHVGDFITQNQAQRLTDDPRYAITVTAEKAKASDSPAGREPNDWQY